jgi:hypothetical protein
MKRALFAFAVAFATSPARADTIVEYGCVVLAETPEGKVDRILPDTKVLEPTQLQSKFSITLPSPYRRASIQCVRSDLVPAENDWKVLRAGYPLFITEKPTGNTITIELDKGQFKGEFPQASVPGKDQLNRLQARMDQLQTSMQNADFPPASPK